MKLHKQYSLPPRVKFMLLFLLAFIILGIFYRNEHTLWDVASTRENSTMKELFATTLEPMGSTMYIWGGGWDAEDLEAGASSTKIGVSPKWKNFADKQDESYDFKEHRLERENGLDCSGYVGWVVYNLFQEKSGRTGYVTTSTDIAENYANRGWGKLIKNPNVFLPGDIVSMEGHVWICLGTCQDGSVLLVHSSPPGVSICGTQIEEGSSDAIELATEFMSENYEKWQEKYPDRAVPQTYLENVSVLRWNSKTLSDAIKYQSLSGEEVLELLRKSNRSLRN